ncbi:hypothetical protein D3C76_1434770 [compost metagenome]
MVRPIDLRRFLQAVRDAHERGTHYDQIKRADRKRNNRGPQRVQKANAFDDQIHRDQPATEKHRKYDEEHEYFVPHHVFAG